MKSISARLAVTVLFALGLTFTLTSDGVAGQERANWRAKLPAGNWTLRVTPAPWAQPEVDLYSVTTDAQRGLGVTKIGLRNLSGSDVAAVKVGWRLFAADRPEASLLAGESPLLGAALAPGEWRVVNYPVVSFAEAAKGLQKGDTLGGNYQIELAVTEVTYRGGVSEAGGAQDARASYVKVSSEPDDATALQCRAKARRAALQRGRGAMFIKAAMWAAPAAQCQDQTCMWSGDCFICNGAPKMGCRVDSCTSCTNTRCEGGDLD